MHRLGVVSNRTPSLALGSASLLWRLVACSLGLAAGIALALLGAAFLLVR